MPYINHDRFFVVARFSRLMPSGLWERASRGERLIVSDLLRRFTPAGKNYGVFFFADGSHTREFPIDYRRPSYLARLAIAYDKWYRGSSYSKPQCREGVNP